MSITRRQFSLAGGSVVALTVLDSTGCDRKPGTTPPTPTTNPPAATGPNKSTDTLKSQKLATEPLLIGPAGNYTTAGLYDGYRDKGVWLVSDSKKLIALSARCTHQGCSVSWDGSARQFACPCHKSVFTLEGDNLPNHKATRPLERLSLSIVDTQDGKQVRVDPTKQFRKTADTDEFSDPAASLPLSS